MKITVLEGSKRKNKKGENKDLGSLSFIAFLIASSDVLPQGSCTVTLSFILTSNGLIWVLYLTFYICQSQQY